MHRIMLYGPWILKKLENLRFPTWFASEANKPYFWFLWSLILMSNERGDRDENFEYSNLSQTYKKCTGILIWTFRNKQKMSKYFCVHARLQKRDDFSVEDISLNLNNSVKSLSNPTTKDSFEISSSWGFRNCHWLLDFIKIRLSYWGLKRRLPFENRPVFFGRGCIL